MGLGVGTSGMGFPQGFSWRRVPFDGNFASVGIRLHEDSVAPVPHRPARRVVLGDRVGNREPRNLDHALGKIRIVGRKLAL